MNPSKMTPEEIDDLLLTRNKVNTWLEAFVQMCIISFVLAMLAAIWFVVELALLVKS